MDREPRTCGPVQNSPSPRPQAVQGLQPDWRTYKFVNIFVHNLPAHVTTSDLYKNFIQYGELDMIVIKDDRGGSWKNQADLRFKPPPTVPFWENGNGKHGFIDSHNAHSLVDVKLSNKQPRNFTVRSPINPDVSYEEEMELEAESIDFGVLTKPRTMMIMKTKESVQNSKVKLILNLKRKEITIRFPSRFRRPLEEHDLYWEKHPWFRPVNRFRISLDQDFSVCQVREPDDKISYILQLHTPPPYSKKSHAHVYGSHVPDARRWLEEEVWLRQTSIDYKSRKTSAATGKPISLQAYDGTINIGRWTAFRIAFKDATRDPRRFRVMARALSDFNTKIVQADNFDYISPIPPVWDFLDKHSVFYADLSTSHIKLIPQLEESASFVLPFSVRYLLEVCISEGKISEYVVRDDFLQKLSILGESQARNRLKLILDLPQSQRLDDPMTVFDNRKFRPVYRKELKLPENCALLNSATVTATTIIFHAPSVEVTNRIVRQYREYADRFLRVRFTDDAYRGSSRIYATTTNKNDAILDRVKHTLTCGLILGDRHYEFLAWGNSQLREHGVYFFASLPGTITASQIRASMGDFDGERIIAKRTARIGQCFSTTRPVQYRLPLVTPASLIDDVKRNGYTFTDGVGKISPLLADMVNQQLSLNKSRTPSVFQIRLGGCKGVVAMAPDLKGVDLRLRNSQFKFPSESNELEVIRSSSTEAARLNRQLILVLSALGVDDQVFTRMLEAEIKGLNLAMHNSDAAQQRLRTDIDANRMTLEIAQMVDNGFLATKEPFMTSLLRLWRAWSLKYLKENARLTVQNGAILLGCVDEAAILRGHYNHLQPPSNASYAEKFKHLPEVFVQVQEPRESGNYVIKEGVCLIARNPSLHEGDIRVVRAVNRPELAHLRDVLVMPQTGDRDLSNMCSGGDLDGDDYIVIWAEDAQNGKFDLLPVTWNAEPMDYTPLTPLRVDGDITLTHYIDFFDQYMRNDFLGRIAHAHLGSADHLDDGIRSVECLRLAHLHSQAVDFPKTGQPAKLPRALDRFEWPHFMEKKGGKTYRSHKILGQLYDKVNRETFYPDYRGTFDERILNAAKPSAAVYSQMEELKREFDSSIRRIMAQHKISTEFEVWSTFVLDHSKASQDYKFHEEIGNHSRSLKAAIEEAIVEYAGGRTFEQLTPYAVAAYQLVQKEVSQALLNIPQGVEEKDLHKHMPFMSFPWVLQNTLGKLATESPKKSPNLDNHPQTVRHDWQGKRFRDPFQPKEVLDGEDLAGVNAETIDRSEVESTTHAYGVEEKLISLSAQTPGVAEQLIPVSSVEASEVEGQLIPLSPLSQAQDLVSGNGLISTSACANFDLLSDDHKESGSEHSIWYGKLMVPDQPSPEQWQKIDNILDSPLDMDSPLEIGSNADQLVLVSGKSTAAQSHIVSIANTAPHSPVSNNGSPVESNLLSSAYSQRRTSSLASADLEGLILRPTVQLSEDGHYISPFRRRKGQLEASGSSRDSRQSSVSDKLLPASRQSSLGDITPPASRRGFSLVSSPAPATAPDPFQMQRTALHVPRAATAIRTAVDSDDEGEDTVFGDPARMTLR